MNAFSPNYVPVLTGPTKSERGGAAAGRRQSELNQQRLDRQGPSAPSTLTEAQKQAGRDKGRSITAGRRV